MSDRANAFLAWRGQFDRKPQVRLAQRVSSQELTAIENFESAWDSLSVIKVNEAKNAKKGILAGSRAR